jgi:putative ABC transport system permease protein
VRGRSGGLGSRPSFTEGDLAAVRERVPDVVAISGLLSTTGRVVAGTENWQTIIEGVHGDFLAVRDWPLGNGRSFLPAEEHAGQKVALLGATVAESLFPGQSPEGATVRIGAAPFTVIGVLDRKGQSASGRDLDDTVLIPIKAARSYLAFGRKLQMQDAGNLLIKITATASTDAAKGEIETVLRERRKTRDGAEDDFYVRDLTAFLHARTAAQNTLSLLLALAAAIALVVGGIGITNVMLVSVSERTKEIGLRLALGARRNDIKRQFLGEALVLCALGCLLGLGLGFAGTLAVNEVVDWDVAPSAATAAGAIAAAVGTCLLFGLYPARKAARLSPMAALLAD